MTYHPHRLTYFRSSSSTHEHIRWLVLLLIILGVILFALLSAVPAHGQYFKTVYNFQGACCSTVPWTLTQGRDANLYGAVTAGGIFSQGGSIYRMTPRGDIKVLHNFDTTEIEQPSGALAMGTDGNLYGLSRAGGLYSYGTFFKITPDGTATVLHDFTGQSDGAWPYGGLIRASDGYFYGTAVMPNPVGYTVFKATSDGAITTICNLDLNHSPGSLILGKDGNFYGISGQGRQVYGSVFKVTPKGVMTDLYTFDGIHGAYPAALVAGAGSNFFGVTVGGGSKGDGVVFMITPQGALTVLHSFDRNNTADGYWPVSLTQASDGKFYGATFFGGLLGFGEIFQITTTGKFLVVHHFNKVNGFAPFTLMQHTSGKMYGSTQQGGLYNDGTLFWFDWALKAFVKLETPNGVIGSSVGIIGNNLSTTSNVTFNGVPASFSVEQDGYLVAIVPSGARTGYVQVTTSTGTVTSNTTFTVTR